MRSRSMRTPRSIPRYIRPRIGHGGERVCAEVAQGETPRVAYCCPREAPSSGRTWGKRCVMWRGGVWCSLT